MRRVFFSLFAKYVQGRMIPGFGHFLGPVRARVGYFSGELDAGTP